jgi:hypothetical protein
MSAENTLPMTVGSTAFLVDRLGQDCAPSQFVRELTQNSIESGATEIRWDVDWISHALEGTYKLCIIDDGCGMSGDEMAEYINRLSSSIHVQTHQGNFGVGAKIAAATRNHEGLIYQSWKDGIGEMVHLWRDTDRAVYGLRQFETPTGKYHHVVRLENDVRPELIENHGTKVILMGMSPEDNTMTPPPDSPSPTKWLSRYLNTRYFRFPETVTVRVREGWEYPLGDEGNRNKFRTIRGQKHYLDSQSVASGEVPLSGATARWWILNDDPKRPTSFSGSFAATGHIGALYADELYEMTTGRGAITKLQNFGVTFGHNRVVIYVEPEPEPSLIPNTSRTLLLRDNQPLPWAEWAAEFRDDFPIAIKDLMDEITAGSVSSDHRQAIRERLRQIRALFQLSRYRPTPNGSVTVDPAEHTAGGVTDRLERERTGSAHPGTSGGRAGSVYAVFVDTNGVPADEVASDPHPVTKWVTLAEETRQTGQMEDRAAEYFRDQNLLLINGDFRVFTDMIERWCDFYSEAAGARGVIQEVVREWFEQSLVETVLGAQALKNDREWSVADLDHALSKEALTAAVMPRYHIDVAVKRALGSKLGPLREKAVAGA